tara:strand:- start:362 stop:955 length:594 start_codon:yes stop_codon:yes gene_type:complete
MKRFYYILILIINPLFSDYYSSDSKPFIQNNSYLAISINPNCNSQYVNYAIITESNGKIIKTRFISGSEFIRIGMGKQPSKANNSGENIFQKFQIKDCLYKYDSSQCLKTPDLKLFDLWALRYNRNPYCPPDCTPAKDMLVDGFGQYKFRPSWPQIQILQKYGITYINDFFYGEKLFKLLADFQKPEWRSKYLNATE